MCRMLRTSLTLNAMEKTVRKYATFEKADAADDERHRRLSGEEKLQILFEMIMPECPDEAAIKRSARVYPLAENAKR